MIKYIKIAILAIGVAYADHQSSGFPGGYLGISMQYGDDKTFGYQFSFGVAVPGFSTPATGSYLFPGIAIGKRLSFKTKKSYLFTDIQITYMDKSGIWVGVGKGLVFMESKQFQKNKFYAGAGPIGIVAEKGYTRKLLFAGFHFGAVVPLFGTMIHQ